MKKLFTLCLGLIAALAVQAQSESPIQFAYQDGTIIPDGTTISLTEYEKDEFDGSILMPSGLYAKNTTEKDVKMKGKYTISVIDNGIFQTCFPVNCVQQKSKGSYETAAGTLAASELKYMQTEWIPAAEGTCSVTYQLNYYEKNALGVESEKEGPKVTVNFTYSTTAINAASKGKDVSSVEYYDLQGRQLSQNAHGLVVKKTVYADGTSKTQKQIILKK